MGSKVRGVGYLVGAARRLHYLVHSHRRADGNTGNTRCARKCLVRAPERDDGLRQNRGYRYLSRQRGGRYRPPRCRGIAPLPFPSYGVAVRVWDGVNVCVRDTNTLDKLFPATSTPPSRKPMIEFWLSESTEYTLPL